MLNVRIRLLNLNPNLTRNLSLTADYTDGGGGGELRNTPKTRKRGTRRAHGVHGDWIWVDWGLGSLKNPRSGSFVVSFACQAVALARRLVAS